MGLLDTAKKLLETGENQVSVHAFEYGEFLCNKSQAVYTDGHLQGALDALNQAISIDQDFSGKDDSALKQVIVESRQLISEQRS